MQTVIRPAGTRDAAAINEIANRYIEHTTVNFDTQPWSLEKRRAWIESFNSAQAPYHLLVADSDGQIAGFCCNTRFRPKAAYDRSTETTVYVDPAMTSRGCGENLYRGLLERIAETDLHRAFAIITLPNAVSLRLHEKLGFTECGMLDEAGWKFNGYHSISIYALKLDSYRKTATRPDA